MQPRTLLRTFLLHAAWIGASALGWAQDLVRVEAHVTAVSSGTLFLDRGLEAGLRTDDMVTVFLEGGLVAEGRVRSATRTGARVELLPGSAAPAVGARAEIQVPRERLGAPVEEGAHPPWERQEPSWDPEKPLLAPAFGTREADRPRTLHGRVGARTSGTFDQQPGGGSYLLSSLGLDLYSTNPFGAGGEFGLDAEFFHRTTQLSGQPDEVDDDLTLRRLSYRIGGTEEEPTRWEFGRFLQREFPELGLLDGAEWTEKLAGGSRLGASAGAMPPPYPTAPSFDDLQAALFYRWSADREERLLIGGALQSTWHKGQQDRNLLVGTLDWIASRELGLHASAWLDYYGPGDTVKSDGFELTELSLSALWHPTERSGVGFSASRRLYPELLRDEFQSVDADQLANGFLERAGASWYSSVGDSTRVSLRGDLWQDQDDSGTTVDAGVAWRDLLWERGELALSGFYSDGSYSSGPGGRISATKGWDAVFATLAYSFTNYDQKGFVGSQASLAHESIFGSLDLTVGEAWDLSIYSEHRFGDELDSWDAGLALQMRF